LSRDIRSDSAISFRGGDEWKLCQERQLSQTYRALHSAVDIICQQNGPKKHRIGPHRYTAPNQLWHWTFMVGLYTLYLQLYDIFTYSVKISLHLLIRLNVSGCSDTIGLPYSAVYRRTPQKCTISICNAHFLREKIIDNAG